jgi:hypothetical protein
LLFRVRWRSISAARKIDGTATVDKPDGIRVPIADRSGADVSVAPRFATSF